MATIWSEWYEPWKCHANLPHSNRLIFVLIIDKYALAGDKNFVFPLVDWRNSTPLLRQIPLGSQLIQTRLNNTDESSVGYRSYRREKFHFESTRSQLDFNGGLKFRYWYKVEMMESIDKHPCYQHDIQQTSMTQTRSLSGPFSSKYAQ